MVEKTNPVHEDDSVGFLEDIKRNSNRVTGGWPAQEGQFPHQISIRMVNAQGLVTSCGGSIIHNEWIITSAHCLVHRPSYVIRLGTTDLHRPAYMLDRSLNDAIIHPLFNLTYGTRVQRADVAVINLGISITYGPTMQPIRLQSSEQKDYNYENQVLVVSGFGFDDDSWNGGDISDYLLWTYLRGLSNEECRTFFNSVWESTVCARFYNHTDQSACHGDSGGPLSIIDRDGKPTMIGLVQFASWRGCTSYWPTAYVRPGHFQDWLTEVTGINFDWTYADIEDKSNTLNVINK
ncbi:collagenase-like [Vanessa atalanta]|uniref:collagenase-like n=1 Tax=Vanessa atalanta TaxID=42275 RepID=UPI001FCDB021|nr:collagenase-like [Vanessa atalanta]